MKSLARDERGVVYTLVVGIGAIFFIGTIWYMMTPAIEEMASFVEGETEENSIAHQSGAVTYTIWTVICIVFILIVIAWMYVHSQREQYGRVPSSI